MPIGQQDRRWLELLHCPGLGPGPVARLMARFPDPEAIAAAPASELRACGLGDRALQGLRAGPDAEALTSDLAWLDGPGRQLLTRPDPAYPEALARIPDPPPVLYLQGRPEALDRGPALAVVGSRSPTRAGREDARAFARDLARAGFTIISGLARGIDAAAHQGALDADGETVGVLGCGPDRIYPAENAHLYGAVSEAGAIATELPVGAPPRAGHFPRRNRIVSGLALGVLVVEAGVRSGALTTARCAGSQGREIYAIPGSIHSPQSRGPHRLIREGAKLVESLEDIVEELRPGATVGAKAAPAEEGDSLTGLSEDQGRVAASLGFEPTSLDTVVTRSGLTPNRVSAILLELEMEGIVAAEPGGFFSRRPHGIQRP